MIIVTPSFSGKAPFSKLFSSQTKMKSRRFQIELFQKPLFS